MHFSDRETAGAKGVKGETRPISEMNDISPNIAGLQRSRESRPESGEIQTLTMIAL